MNNRLELTHQIAENAIRSFTVACWTGDYHELVFENTGKGVWRRTEYCGKNLEKVLDGAEIDQDEAINAIRLYAHKANTSRDYELLVEYYDSYKAKVNGVTEEQLTNIVGSMFQTLDGKINNSADEIKSMISHVIGCVSR